MDAKRARLIIDTHQCEHCYCGMEENSKYAKLFKAKGYFAALEGPEIKALIGFLRHDDRCACVGWEAGEPTSDGGYRSKIRGKWYQTKAGTNTPLEQTPNCDCGLSESLITFYRSI